MRTLLLSTLRHGWDAVRRLPERLGSGRFSLKASPGRPDPDLSAVLAHWGIGDYRVKRIAIGGSASNWIVNTQAGKYVLRNAGKPSPHVEFQVLVMNHVAESEFPYRTPQLLETGEGCSYKYHNEVWLLYPFIEGYPARKIATTAEANAVGRLVAQYHQTISQIDRDRVENFAVYLFQVEETCSVLQESTAAMRAHKRLRRSEVLWLQAADSVLPVYASIPEAAKQAIQQLDLIPVYNDWYPDNILMLDRNIVGLIDFDSVVAAPYILDLQNALLYAAGTRSGFDAEKIRAFIQGYVSVRPLCRPELELIHPLMIDRIMFLVARAMKGGWPEADRRKDGLIAFLGRNLAWMVDHQEDFREHLAIAASTASSPRPPRIGLQ